MAYHQLTQEERYTISRNKALGMSVRGLAVITGRAPSTISRELHRNATTGDGVYRAEKAHSYAVARRRRCRRGTHVPEAVLQEVDFHLRQRLSPEQVVGLFAIQGRQAPSRETIYRRIRRDKKQGGFLSRYTRIMSKTGRKRRGSRPARGVLHGKRHISERPACVNERLRIGDWEGDTVMGKDTKHCLLTLVERKSGFLIIRKLKDRTARAVTEAIQAVIDRHIFHTITFDNGTEFARHGSLADALGLRAFFCDPHSPWQKGGVENAIGRLRGRLPRKTDLDTITLDRLDAAIAAYNNTPRKCLAFRSPAEVFFDKLLRLECESTPSLRSG